MGEIVMQAMNTGAYIALVIIAIGLILFTLLFLTAGAIEAGKRIKDRIERAKIRRDNEEE